MATTPQDMVKLIGMDVEFNIGLSQLAKTVNDYIVDGLDVQGYLADAGVDAATAQAYTDLVGTNPDVVFDYLKAAGSFLSGVSLTLLRWEGNGDITLSTNEITSLNTAISSESDYFQSGTFAIEYSHQELLNQMILAMPSVITF